MPEANPSKNAIINNIPQNAIVIYIGEVYLESKRDSIFLVKVKLLILNEKGQYIPNEYLLDINYIPFLMLKQKWEGMTVVSNTYSQYSEILQNIIIKDSIIRTKQTFCNEFTGYPYIHQNKGKKIPEYTIQQNKINDTIKPFFKKQKIDEKLIFSKCIKINYNDINYFIPYSEFMRYFVYTSQNIVNVLFNTSYTGLYNKDKEKSYISENGELHLCTKDSLNEQDVKKTISKIFIDETLEEAVNNVSNTYENQFFAIKLDKFPTFITELKVVGVNFSFENKQYFLVYGIKNHEQQVPYTSIIHELEEDHRSIDDKEGLIAQNINNKKSINPKTIENIDNNLKADSRTCNRWSIDIGSDENYDPDKDISYKKNPKKEQSKLYNTKGEKVQMIPHEVGTTGNGETEQQGGKIETEHAKLSNDEHYKMFQEAIKNLSEFKKPLQLDISTYAEVYEIVTSNHFFYLYYILERDSRPFLFWNQKHNNIEESELKNINQNIKGKSKKNISKTIKKYNDFYDAHGFNYVASKKNPLHKRIMNFISHSILNN